MAVAQNDAHPAPGDFLQQLVVAAAAPPGVRCSGQVVAQDVLSGASRLTAHEGVTVRWFPGSHGPARLAVPRPLWRQLKITAANADVVDVHTDQAAFALAVSRAGARRLVLTPHASVHQLMAWPHTR